MPAIEQLSIKIFADGADLEGIRSIGALPFVQGFTTNPTLMRKAGVSDYKAFALEVLGAVGGRPVSFEVFADDFEEMEAQALEIASWGPNVNVKIPVTDTRGATAAPLVQRLSERGVVCNVTAMFTIAQFEEIVDALHPGTDAILSLFAGRIADTGVDPVPIVRQAVEISAAKPKAEVLWASPREILNLFQADEAGCHIITVTNDMLKKLSNIGKNLSLFSRETVEMFFNDASAAGYAISLPEAAR